MSTDRQEVTLIFFFAPPYVYTGGLIIIIMKCLARENFSRSDENAPDAPKAGALCQSSDPLSGRSDSRVIVLCLPRRTNARSREAAHAHALEYCIRSDEGRGQASLLFPYGRLSSRKENPSWGPHRRLLARLRYRSVVQP